jgi:hypothetical protein
MVAALDTFIGKFNAGETIPEVATIEKKGIDISHLKPATKRKSTAKSKASAKKKTEPPRKPTA